MLSLFKKEIAVLLVQMIEDFIQQKKAEGKEPTLELMMQEIKDGYIEK